MLYFEYALQPTLTDTFRMNQRISSICYMSTMLKARYIFQKAHQIYLCLFLVIDLMSFFENTSSKVFLIRHTYNKISNGKSQNNFLSLVFPNLCNVEFCIKVLFFFENVITKARNPFCIFNTICGKETEKKSLRGGSNHLHI